MHVIAVAAKHLFQNCLAGWYPIALETQNNTSAVLHDNINLKKKKKKLFF